MSLLGMIDAARHTFAWEGEARVGLPWVWRRISRVHAAYAARALVQAGDDGEFLRVTVNGRPYAWPRTSPPEELLWITCELDEPDHPHQYLWGPTTVSPGDVVIDVGACEGAFSALVAERGARPVVVEPSPTMRRVVRRLFALRDLPAPTIVAAALSDQSGTAFFADAGDDVQAGRLGERPDGNPTAGGGYDVPVRTIDEVVADLGLPRVDFIKCDAEGADFKVLRGAIRTLERHRPKLAFCTYHDDAHFKEMRDVLKPLGYRMKGKGLRKMDARVRVVLLHAW